MGTYCLAYRKYTNNVNLRNTSMANKMIKNKSKCGECFSDKTRFMK